MSQICKYILFKLPDSHREAVDLRSFPSEKTFPTGSKKLYFQGHTQSNHRLLCSAASGVDGGGVRGRAPHLNKSRKHAVPPPEEGY